MASPRLAVAVLVATVALAVASSEPPLACDPDGPKLDCGHAGTDEAACAAAGCCWQPLAPGSAEPWCFAPNGGDSAYVVLDGDASASTALRGAAAFTLVQAAATLREAGEDCPRLTATVDASCSDVFRLRLAPPGAYAVPPSLFAGGLDPAPCPDRPAYAAYVKHAPFGVHVASTNDPGDAGAPLLDTTGRRLIVKTRYVEWTTGLHPQSTLYGLGERTGGLVVDRGGDGRPSPPPRTIWARDRPAWAPGENLYGAWPAWMEVLPSGSARGGLVVSGTAVDVVARPSSLSFRSTGGSVDVFIFAGRTPAAVMDQLTRVVGRPALPPAWALGVHQSRWGYESVDALTAVVDGYEAAGLPLDVLWSDIDAMRGRRDFTLAPKRYAADRMRALVGRLHAGGRRWVPIVDPGIKVEKGYAPYDAGLAAGVFIRKPTGDGPFQGRVWPGDVHWPDFVAAGGATAGWWAWAIATFHALIPFDGLWIDMNEPSNFNDGSGGGGGGGGCQAAPRRALAAATARQRPAPLPSRRPGAGPVAAERPPPGQPLSPRPAAGGVAPAPHAPSPQPPPPFLPYPVNNGGARLPLASHTLPPDAVGVDSVLHVDTHNLYGHAEAAATYRALKALNATARPFILTRSSFVGTGAFAAHWSGDNKADWEDLAWSISSVLASGLAGLPMAGADVCGFSANTTPELCARWVGVAALQPFFRDHSDLSAAPQELYRWPETSAAAAASLRLRYALLPSLYAALARAAATGSPAARPLWFEWPGLAAARADRPQWLIGDALMAVPVVESGVSAASAWLPPGSAWVDVRAVLGGQGGQVLRGNVTLDAPLTGAPPVLLRCGRAVPTAAARRTAEETLSGAALTFVACLDADGGGVATGEFFVDDGLTEAVTSAWFDLRADGRGLNVTARGGAAAAAVGEWRPNLAQVAVVGVAEGAVGRVVRARDACGSTHEGAASWVGSLLVVRFEGGGVPVVCGQGRSGVSVWWWGGSGRA